MAKCEMKFSCRFHYTKIRGLYDYNINALRCLTPPGIDGTTVSVLFLSTVKTIRMLAN